MSGDGNKLRFIFSNGAFKSGSTWIYSILNQMLTPTEVEPSDVCHNRSHWMASTYFPRMLRRGDCAGLYVVKSHLYTRFQLKQAFKVPNALYINISRDVKDAVVSAYFHFNRSRKDKLSFEEYYWRVGRYKAYEIFVYDRAWKRFAGSSNVYLMKYEDLKEQFDEEVAGLGEFVGVNVGQEMLESIRQGTSIEALRKSWNEDDKKESERFFRKGVVGDWKNHFTEKTLNDLSIIESKGFGRLDWCKFMVFFYLRRNVQYYLFNRA